MTETPHLALPYLAAAQAQKHVTHNEALGRLDVVVQLGVLDSALSEPPDGPEEGDRYIVGPDAAGGWAGHDGDVAAFVDGAWLFLAPRSGWIALDAASGTVLVRQGGDWATIGSLLGAVARLGVNTTADDTSRLAVRSEAALFAAIDAEAGGSGDIRLVASKAGGGNTASLLFQTGFSGRAEIGLAGDDDLVVKVSPDGASWTEGLRVDGATGVPMIRYDNTTSGLAATSLEAAIDELAGSTVTGPGSASDGAPAVFDGTSGRVLRESTFADFKTSLALANADVGLGNVLNVPQREQLTAHRTYYVRTDGSDSNDGMTNSSGGAFLTIQKAIDTAYGLDFGIFNITISVQSGTYSGAVSLNGRHTGAGVLTIAGSSATIDRAGNAIVATNGAQVTINGFTITTSAGHCLSASSGARVTFGASMTFGACANSHMWIEFGATVTCTAAYTISGNAIRHVILTAGTWVASSITVTLTGTPAFSGAFLYGQTLSLASLFGITWSGAATGVRYGAISNSVINTFGGGATHLPGSSAGSTATGGQYV